MSHAFLILKKPSFLTSSRILHSSFFTFPLNSFSLITASAFFYLFTFLPFYLFTFKKPFYLFTFKKPFYL